MVLSSAPHPREPVASQSRKKLCLASEQCESLITVPSKTGLKDTYNEKAVAQI